VADNCSISCQHGQQGTRAPTYAAPGQSMERLEHDDRLHHAVHTRPASVYGYKDPMRLSHRLV
jgi:hypothetical protein